MKEGEKIMATINPIQLQKYLKGMDYPARKADLIKRADQEFASAADVSKAIGAIDHKS